MQLLPPPKTQGALCSLDGRVITPALCGLGGGGSCQDLAHTTKCGGTPSTPACGWPGGGAVTFGGLMLLRGSS